MKKKKMKTEVYIKTGWSKLFLKNYTLETPSVRSKFIIK